MTEEAIPPTVYSYWRDEFDPDATTPFGVLVELGGDDESVPQNEAVAEQLTLLADGARVSVVTIDPYVGAGGYGLAIFWDVVSKGADILTWLAAAKVVVPQLRRIADAANERYAIGGSPTYFTPSAIEALYVADLVQREPHLESSIENVTIQRLGPVVSEPREELLHMYAAYVVSVTGVHDSSFFVRAGLVNSRAILIGETATVVPIPNTSHWGDHPDEGRSLYTGPVRTR